jgi:Tfp pilus assembly protein PilV
MQPASPARRNDAFTLIEVGMASLMLVVAFIGMIEAVIVSSNKMDAARRQTLGFQIMSHHIEKLRLLPWDVTTTAPNELCINDLPTASTAIAIDCPLWPGWLNTATYVANNVVSYNGAWYRCILANSNQVPTNTTYWTAVTAGLTTDIVAVSGAAYSLSRSVSNMAYDNGGNVILREVTFTVTWVVKTSRLDSSGNPISFTYTRVNSAWYGKYGLNLTYQRS